MKMISWQTRALTGCIFLPVENCRPMRSTGFEIICSFPPCRSLEPLPFISLTPSSLPLASSTVLSFAFSLLLSQSDAYTLLRGSFTALSRGSFCARQRREKALLQQPFIPRRLQVRELSRSRWCQCDRGVRSRVGDKCSAQSGIDKPLNLYRPTRV